MKIKVLFICLLFCSASYASSAQHLKLPKIDARPIASDYSFLCSFHTQSDLPSVKALEASSGDEWLLDLRSCDLSKLDLSGYPANLADYADFDSKTRWPKKSKMPQGFHPKKILKSSGRNPGLGMRSLHARGINGRGVSIAIIDQNLLTTHKEYAKQLKLYEQQDDRDNKAAMHGAAVASIAVGKTVGVAPKADLFYISAEFEEQNGVFNALPIAQTLEHIYEINEQLPKKQKIRVVSISRGFASEDIGAEEFSAAREKLEKSGVAVFTTNDVFTLSRANAEADPDKNAVYTRGAYWFGSNELYFYNTMEKILFPTDFRITAAPNGNGEYVSYATGGLSWAVPYAAGLYALGAQVYPDITPELFWKTIKETAVSSPVILHGRQYAVAKYLVQPAAFIEKLEQLNKLDK